MCTTSALNVYDSLMFLIWALSLPQNTCYQDRLRAELSHISVDAQGWPHPRELRHLPYLNAILRESLRMYLPLPAFEPRVCGVDTVIDVTRSQPALSLVCHRTACIEMRMCIPSPSSSYPRDVWKKMDRSSPSPTRGIATSGPSPAAPECV